MSPIFTKTGSLFARVVSSQTFKRGIAGAAGAILTATLSELLFPERGVNDALEEALLYMWRQAWLRLRRRAGDVAETVADVLRPDPPLYLSTLDGGTVTGVVVLQVGQAVAFLGRRHPSSVAQRQAPASPDGDGWPWGQNPDQYRR